MRMHEYPLPYSFAGSPTFSLSQTMPNLSEIVENLLSMPSCIPFSILIISELAGTLPGMSLTGESGGMVLGWNVELPGSSDSPGIQYFLSGALKRNKYQQLQHLNSQYTYLAL